MNPVLAKYVYYTIQNIRKEPVQKFLAEMKHNDQLSRDEILEIQFNKAIKFIRHAYHNSQYYTELFNDNNIDTSQLSTIDDFKIIPVLTKDALRENLNKIRIKDYPLKTTIAKTSGSTGKVLKFVKDRDATAAHNASYYRGISWHGIDVGAKEAMLWGVPVDRIPRYQIRMIDFMLNRFREKEYNLKPDTLIDFYKKVKRKKPAILWGYSSMIYHFARFLKENSIDSKNLGLKIVKCTSETIHDETFDLVKEVFDCPLVVEYGAAETNIIAFSCEKGGIHLMADFVLTEFEEPDDTALGQEYKELIVTSLYNYSLPIIRYKIGDLGIASNETCSCGRNLPLIKKIIGRSGSLVIATNGDKYHSIFFYYVFKGLQEKRSNVVSQFKVYQKSKDWLQIHIVKDKNFNPEVVEYLDNAIKEQLGSDMKIDYEFPEFIAREKSGKIRDFVSEIPQN